MSADLRAIAMMDPADVMVAVEAYYGSNKGYYFGGYIAGYVLCRMGSISQLMYQFLRRRHPAWYRLTPVDALVAILQD